MTAPLQLPRLCWGEEASPRALLVHGLGSSAALMWRFGVTLADAGWHASAVDLRGHGAAPRALDCTVAAFGADLGATMPDTGGAWDLVVAHSLGGAAATLAATANADWTRRLVLVDPAIVVAGRDTDIIRRSQERAFADNRIEAVRAERPEWHPVDVELKVDAVTRASRWMVEQVSVQNPVWDLRTAAAALRVPTHILGADPAVYSLFTGDVAEEVVEGNAQVTMSIISGAGHSPHRDRPEATMAELLRVIG